MGLIAKKVVGEVMIIERLARYDAHPRPPSDTCQLIRAWCVSIVGRFQVWFGRHTITSRLLVVMVAGLAEICGESIAIFAMNSRACCQSFAFTTWYSCSSCVVAHFMHEFFFCESIAKWILLQLTCIKPLPSFANYPCKTFFTISLRCILM